jgi:hypothetical protein
MNFQVFWVSDAEDELAAIWIDADDRNAITTAAHRIDSVLRVNPENAGESRDEGQRILIERPLGVTFDVSAQDRTVFVLTVWRFVSHRDNP